MLRLPNYLSGMLVLLAVGCRAGTTSESGTTPTAHNDEGKNVALVSMGEVDSALVTRMKEWIEFNSAIPVRVLDPQPLAGETLDDVGRAVAKKVGPDSVGTIILVAPASDALPHGIFIPDGRIAVVNIRAMQAAGDPERFAQRIERQVMRSIGLLMDMETCPNPQCSLCAYDSLAYLDETGRNICPPCLDRLQHHAEDMGIHLKEENAMNLIKRVPQ